MTLKIFACGDIVNSRGKENFISQDLQHIIHSCDIAIGNFEAPIKTLSSLPIDKAGPHVSQSKNSVNFLKKAGFNFVSLANNHIYDYGEEGLNATLTELSKCEIDTVGGASNFDAAYAGKIIEQQGIKVGLLAACENEFGCLYEKRETGGYAWLFHPLLEDNIRALKNKVDVVLLIAHAGVENIAFPIKEWRDRYKRLCDVGVDVVIGHHPHVPQGFEKYNTSTIFYSLGNFYFDTAGYENKSDDSYSLVLELSAQGLVNFDIVYHKKILGVTCLVEKNKVNFSLEHLNRLLGVGYKKRNEVISIELLNKYYLDYYRYSLGSAPQNSSLLLKTKYLIRKFLFKSRCFDRQNLLLLHNIRIDTHRFVVQRALSLLSENKH